MELEFLARIAGESQLSAYEIVFNGYGSGNIAIAPGLEDLWKKVLFNGFSSPEFAALTDVKMVQSSSDLNQLLANVKVVPPFGQQSRSRFLPRRKSGRWSLRQQRLDAGIARPHHEDDVGQCRAHQPQDGARAWGAKRRSGGDCVERPHRHRPDLDTTGHG